MTNNFVRKLFAAALGAVILSCGDSHPTGPSDSNGPQVKADAISSEGAAGPTMATDRLDYAPGDTVLITGAGWQPNESISLMLTRDSAAPDTTSWNVVADTLGGFLDRTYEVKDTDLGRSFQLIATGAATADTAQGMFTDSDLSLKTNFGIMTVNLKYFGSSSSCGGSPDSIATAVSVGTTPVTTYRNMLPTNGLLVFALNPPPGMSFVNWTSTGAGGSTVSVMLNCFNSVKTWTANFAFNTTTAIAADSVSPQTVGTSITFTATVTKDADNSAVSVDKVKFYDGGTDCTAGVGTQIGSINGVGLSSSGTASVSTSSLTAGTHTIRACYQGSTAGDPDILPSSSTLSFTMNPASVATTTAVNASPASPSEYGTSVTFTATVTQTSGGAAVTSGNVAFRDTNCSGTILQAAAAVDGSGQKTYTTSSLSVGAHTIAACYEGATGFNASNGTTSYTINKISTGTGVIADKTSPQPAGTSLTFTASVTRTTGGAAVTLGNVRFIEGGTCASPAATLQTAAAVNGSGQVTYSTSALAVGAHTIAACYDGDTNYDISTGSINFTIDSAATTTTVTPNPASPSEFGTSVTFTAGVTSGGNAVTSGNVRFVEGTCAAPTTTLQAASAVNGSGEVTYTTSSLSVGGHTVRACFDGSGNFASSTGTSSYTISKIATGTAVTTNLSSPQNVGAAVTFTATVTRTTGGAAVTTGDVRFIEGGTCASPTTTLQGASAVNGSGQVTFDGSGLAAGSHTVVACYDGTTTIEKSEGSKAFTFNLAATTTIVTPSPSSPREYGTSVTFTAAVTSGGNAVSSGNVRFIEGGDCTTPTTTLKTATGVNGSGEVAYTTTDMSVGSHTIVACYDGTSSFATSNGSAPYTINKIGTTTTLTSDLASPQPVGTSIVFTAEVNRTNGGANVIQGNVAFYDGGSCASPGTPLQASAAVDGDGKKTLSTSSLAFGNHTIVACYEGNDTLATSGDSKAYEITKIATTTSLTSNVASPTEYGTSVTFTAEVNKSSGGADVTLGNVIFYDGGSCEAPGTIVQTATAVSGTGTVTYTPTPFSVGNHTIVACYQGTSTFEASGDSKAFTVNKVATTTLLSATPSGNQEFGTEIVFTAEVNRTTGGANVTQGSVAFYEGGSCTGLGTELQGAGAVDVDGKKTYTTSSLALGNHKIVACYQGNDTLATSGDDESFEITKILTTTTLTQTPSGNMEYGTGVTFDAEVNRTNGGTNVTTGNIKFVDGADCTGTVVKTSAAVSGTGTASYTPSPSLSVGAHHIIACYEGTSTIEASDDDVSLTISKIGTTTSLSSDLASPQLWSTSIMFTAEVNRTTGSADVGQGDVAFYDGGTCASPTATLQAAAAVGSDGKKTLTINNLSVGNHTILACYLGNDTLAISGSSMSYTINKIPTTVTLALTPSSQQQYSDSVHLSASISPSGVAGSVQFQKKVGAGVYSNIGSPVTVASGAAAATYTVLESSAAGGLTFKAIFTPSDTDHYDGDDDTKTLTVTKENAKVAFDAANPAAVQVTTPGSNLYSGSPIVFAITVREMTPDTAAAKAAPGDVNNAGLTASLTPIAGGSAITLACNGSASGSGYSQVKTFSCSTGSNNLPLGTYQLDASVTGDYYLGSDTDAFTVFDPTLGFATGGGTYNMSGDRVNFGFTMKYNKSGTNLQGNMIVVRHNTDGTVSRIKSNSLGGLALSSGAGCGTAQFSGKATYTTWSNTINDYVNTGNNSFTVYAQDCNNPGTGYDWIWVDGPGNLDMPMTAEANKKQLTGGNIAVPHNAK